MRNKWTLSGDLKSPGLKTVPVRFRLAAPENPRISYEIRGFSCQFDLIFIKYRLIQCAVLMRHDRGADSVAGDINGSTRHIEDTVDTHDPVSYTHLTLPTIYSV